jgi:hypothetical protein
MGIRKSPVGMKNIKPGCIRKSQTNNLPAPTDMTENPYGEKKLFFRDATQKSASVVLSRIQFWIVPWYHGARRPIFEKCSRLREKGGVLTLRTPHWVSHHPLAHDLIRHGTAVLRRGGTQERCICVVELLFLLVMF